MRIGIVGIFISFLVLSSCKSPRVLKIGDKNFKNEIDLTIESYKRYYSVPLLPLIPLEYFISIGDPISMVAIYADDSTLLWRIESNDSNSSVADVRYGVIPKKFTQIIPSDGQRPSTLMIGSIYLLELQTKTGFYTKRFIFNTSEIYLKP